jgi:hypothetical protein
LARATEGFIDLRRRLVLIIVLNELNIDGLIRSNTHEVKRGTAVSDHLEISSILRVVKAAQRSILNTEAILPEV